MSENTALVWGIVGVVIISLALIISSCVNSPDTLSCSTNQLPGEARRTTHNVVGDHTTEHVIYVCVRPV